MENSFQIFRTFTDKESAIELQKLLSDHKIHSDIGNNIPSADITFVNNTLLHQYEVRISLSDFERAEKLMITEISLDEIDPSHYLFEFNDDELYEILMKPDEWHPQDYKLALQILKKRGKTVDENLLKSLKNLRLNQLAEPENNQRPWIIMGYVFAFCGGLLGLIIGYSLSTFKKNLPNGERVYSYSKSDRKHGRYILGISILLTPLFLSLKFIKGL